MKYVFIHSWLLLSVGREGILSEAKWLLDSGLLPNSNSATRAIGYRQVYSQYYIFLFSGAVNWQAIEPCFKKISGDGLFINV